jgi:hypothetical protein
LTLGQAFPEGWNRRPTDWLTKSSGLFSYVKFVYTATNNSKPAKPAAQIQNKVRPENNRYVPMKYSVSQINPFMSRTEQALRM